MSFLNSFSLSSGAASASISLSSIGSSLSSSSSSCSSGARKGVQYNPGSQDKKFSEIITDTPYKDITGVPGKFNVSINRKICGHWFLLFELEGSTLPNLSLEISTADVESIKREIYTHNDNGKSTPCGIIQGTLTSIINVADRIVAEMEYYRLFTSNCQHFCNNFLNHYGFEVYSTTLGKDVTVEIEKLIKSDLTPEQNALKEEIVRMMLIGDNFDTPTQQPGRSEMEARIRRHFAALLNGLVGAR